MLKKLVKILPLSLIEKYEFNLLDDYKKAKNFLTNSDPEIFEIISERKVLNMFRLAARRVPAYKKFLKEHGVKPGRIKTINDFNKKVPQTTKSNYVEKYSHESRCIGGKFPLKGNIDESSGSSGVPTNWVRSVKEEALLCKVASFEFNYAFEGHKKKYIVISAWSSGPWATGVKFCEIVEHLALVKNTSTHIDSVVRTIKLFGPKHHYMIAGYPPFIKRLMDESSKRIKWKDYKIDILTGGEGIIVGWRRYIKKKLGRDCTIVSSYGASDLDIGIGFETPFAIFIRRLASQNEALRKELFGKADRIPMIFQYNPSMHYIRQVPVEGSNNNANEYEITLLDSSVASPKVKYNIHDEGGVIKYNDMIAALKKHEPKFLVKFSDYGKITDILKLPFLYIVGRSDGTISLDGANVYPQQIEMCIYSDKQLLGKTNNFKMKVEQDKNHNTRFTLMFELKKGIEPTKSLQKMYKELIVKELVKLNPDYKESLKHNPALEPKVKLHKYDDKLFSKEKSKIKLKYIEKK
jgi:phenylacetate-CoA ligase